MKTDLVSCIATKQDLLVLQQYHLIAGNSLGSCFPNVENDLHIICHCGYEHPISKMKRIKNELRSTDRSKQIKQSYSIELEPLM